MNRHFTTRRGFVGACGFGILGLYGLWAGYGAAPLPFLRPHDEPAGAGHAVPPVGGRTTDSPRAIKDSAPGGHAGEALSPEDFRRNVEEFAARYRQPDGSVRPGARANPRALIDMRPDRGAAGRADGAADAHDAHAGHGMAHAEPAGPDDVYLMAYQWGFEPAVLRLEANRAYRLRMMAVDVSHGAAVQLGRGSRIVRLRTNALVEQTMTFARAGEHLVYCTVYCGPGHARMQGRLIVA